MPTVIAKSGGKRYAFKDLTERPATNYRAGSNWYATVHMWLKSNYGQANHCVNPECLGTAKRFEWSNKSGKYLRDIRDWQQLCAKCHRLLDQRKDYCKWGHEFTPENTMILNTTTGRRACRICRRRDARKAWHKNKPIRDLNKKPPISHCKRGHLFTKENTYSHTGRRHCKACRAIRREKYYASSI